MHTTPDRYSLLETKFKDKSNETHRLQTRVSELEVQLDLKGTEMQSELQALRSKLTIDFQEEKKRLQEEINNLTLEQQRSSSALISQLNNLKIDFENLSQKYLIEQEKNNEFHTQVSEYKKKAESLQEQLQSSNSTIAILKSKYGKV
jgi:chromosome segregation ATPase